MMALVNLRTLTDGSNCSRCDSKNTFLKIGNTNTDTQVWYCWDCHKPFIVKKQGSCNAK